jgi:hypothetical protein
MADASKSVMKTTKVDLPAENGFLDRMVRYLDSPGGPAEGREALQAHPAPKV